MKLPQTVKGEFISEPETCSFRFKSFFRTGWKALPGSAGRHGNIIDGQHHLAADENWPKIRLENIQTEEQLLVARLVSNDCRRHMPAEEKTEMLKRLGEIYLSEGVEAEEIAYKIAEKTGMSYTWL